MAWRPDGTIELLTDNVRRVRRKDASVQSSKTASPAAKRIGTTMRVHIQMIQDHSLSASHKQ